MKIIENYKNLAQKYEILSQIGAGGMSAIYLAKNKENGQKVAIKVMNSKLSKDEKALKRLENEIRLTKKINSRNVMKVFDYCLDTQEEEYWIALEFIDGTVLKSALESVGSFTISEVISLGCQIIAGVKAIHTQKTAHRDLKDTNIMINSLKEIKIIDLGIAKDLETPDLTKETSVIGSVQYMAPELFSKSSLDAEEELHKNQRADIYAIGILLYQMVIGSVPFNDKNSMSGMVRIKEMQQSSEIPNIRSLRENVPQGLINVIKKAVAKDPRNRYKTLEDFYKDLTTANSPKRLNEPEVDFSKKKKKSFVDVISGKTGTIIVVCAFLVVALVLVLAILAFKGVF
ncbi:serine/threonine-protein kinase [Mycoplasma procyoni]|uniref:serine/threonine-protein kinase n=1 Tax=Mycoplasma procyoni TaxID=568784 RepID=UPI00197B46C4|nr:serine/threonine-protein kinase [Mycoplasma procyoni]MBN3534429.1 serine/threonine protein kinase [Mycoplasma procyoni]